MKFGDLAEQDDIILDTRFSDNTVGSIFTNTDEAIKNGDNTSLFICIKGSKYDTHNDIEKLISNGIINIIAEKEIVMPDLSENVNIMYSPNTRKSLAIASRLFFGCPDKKLKIIGITGTKGKTTVSYMIKNAFEVYGINCGLIGTNGIIYGSNRYECNNSTPGAYEYYYHLKKMADSEITHVVVEITSQSLKQYRTFGTVFDIAVFTNLYPDHIGEDEHSDFNEYRLCKSRIFESCRKAVLNMDDENYNYFANVCSETKVQNISFSRFLKSADYKCKFFKMRCVSSEFRLLNNKISVPLPGDFNLTNALCASVVLLESGIPINAVVEGLKNIRIPGRCEYVENPSGVNIIIDYAHSKESLENILKALKRSFKGKLYCVFGSGGDRSTLRRSGMGEAAAKYADFSVITSDNPRSENPKSIIDDILKGIPENFRRYTVIADREQAIFYALSKARKGDTVLLAGKGTQNFQEINGVKYHFDEREVVSRYYMESVIQQ